MRSSTITAARGHPEAPARPELRREQRLHTLFLTGKLLTPSGETICRVRNISPHGFMADACPAPAIGTLVALELCEGRSDEARVAWTQAGRFGAEFTVPQSVHEMIDGGVRSPRHRERALRVAPKGGFATIAHGARSVQASILNISQTGMAVFAYELLLPAALQIHVGVEIDGLDPMTARLCWTALGAAGIQFDRPLSFETLSHWLWATALATSPVAPVH